VVEVAEGAETEILVLVVAAVGVEEEVADAERGESKDQEVGVVAMTTKKIHGEVAEVRLEGFWYILGRNFGVFFLLDAHY
jgi:hypothetical protein